MMTFAMRAMVSFRFVLGAPHVLCIVSCAVCLFEAMYTYSKCMYTYVYVYVLCICMLFIIYYAFLVPLCTA